MKRQRKRFWVDPPLQLQMIALVMVLVCGSLALVCFSAFQGLREAAERSSQVLYDLDWFGQAMRAPLILSSLISLLSSVLIALAWSHRFAGPLRVLAAEIRRLKEGNFSVPVRIRRLDTHQGLIAEFSAMQEALKGKAEADRKAAAQAAEELSRLAAGLPKDQADRIEKIASAVKRLGSGYQL